MTSLLCWSLTLPFIKTDEWLMLRLVCKDLYTMCLKNKHVIKQIELNQLDSAKGISSFIKRNPNVWIINVVLRPLFNFFFDLPLHRIIKVNADYTDMIPIDPNMYGDDILSHSLINISLDYCRGLRDISFIKNFPNLLCLSFYHSDGITDITPVGYLHKLKSLNIVGCDQITDISCIKKLKHLVFLNIDQCIGVTSESRLEIIELLPDLDIYF